MLFCLFFFGCVQPQGAGRGDESIAGGPALSGISVKKVYTMIENDENFILIDTRSSKEYAPSHLPKALSIPICDKNNFVDQLPEDKDQLLIFYCGWPGCIMSTTASEAAAQAGYENIKVMNQGIAGWVKAGYPTVAVDDFVLSGNPVLIDLRASRKDTVQRIPGSVSIPLATLEDRLDDIPARAPIVVYSDTLKESRRALTTFRAAGFNKSKISMVNGNFQGWKKRGNPLTSGPITTKVSWTRKPGKGEVSLSEFKKALSGRMNAVILDVRTNGEAAAGKLKNSIHIPLDELDARKGELPKNKKIFIHCSNGARADMASDILRKSGFSSFFLSATVECKGNDCIIKNE